MPSVPVSILAPECTVACVLLSNRKWEPVPLNPNESASPPATAIERLSPIASAINANESALIEASFLTSPLTMFV